MNHRTPLVPQWVPLFLGDDLIIRPLIAQEREDCPLGGMVHAGHQVRFDAFVPTANPSRCELTTRAPSAAAAMASWPSADSTSVSPSVLASRPWRAGDNHTMRALPEDTRPGLRERKKAKTRAAIRAHALHLFREQGYPATTVEQIAAAAEVSQSTFFRYFPTKEDLVLADDFDELMIAALEQQPQELSPVAALRAATREAMAGLSGSDVDLFRQATALAVGVPELRARMLDEFARTIEVIAAALAARVRRESTDAAVRTIAGAVLGVAFAAWFAAGDDLDEYFRQFDAGLAHLEAGLPL